MNTYKRTTLKPDFAPPTRFEVQPVPYRAQQDTELEQLKTRLLKELLLEAENPEQNVLLRRAANDALALAWATPFPLLLFPTLLEEKAAAMLAHNEQQQRILGRGLNPVLTVV